MTLGVVRKEFRQWVSLMHFTWENSTTRAHFRRVLLRPQAEHVTLVCLSVSHMGLASRYVKSEELKGLSGTKRTKTNYSKLSGRAKSLVFSRPCPSSLACLEADFLPLSLDLGLLRQNCGSIYASWPNFVRSPVTCCRRVTHQGFKGSFCLTFWNELSEERQMCRQCNRYFMEGALDCAEAVS